MSPRATRRDRESVPSLAALHERYVSVRERSRAIASGLHPEDMMVQSMEDASPMRWHLAHTTWFFETFVLERWEKAFVPHHPAYRYLFNSYYEGVGPQFPRPKRGLLSRPTVAEVLEYRARVDERMAALLVDGRVGDEAELAGVVEIGLHHEQQHQELMFTDIKHAFSTNPLRPAFGSRNSHPVPAAEKLSWIEHAGGVCEIGMGEPGFAFDNERPRHKQYLGPFALAQRAVTSGEFLEFVEDGGYQTVGLWLSDGWARVQAEGRRAPLYWERRDGEWLQFTLSGMHPLAAGEPVCHISYFEADAYAAWAGARLPTEAEWEKVAASCPVAGNLSLSDPPHPRAAPRTAPGVPAQLFGDVWEWTRSAYAAYPGYRPLPGAIGEYNGKFMCGQLVLRGGSCATPEGHIRASYRNFFPPDARWQFSGLRLARDLG